MLFQLENSTQEELDMLLEFAQQKHLELSLIDDELNNNYFLPGKPPTPAQLTQLIQKSRNSGTINMDESHKLIRNLIMHVKYTTEAFCIFDKSYQFY